MNERALYIIASSASVQDKEPGTLPSRPVFLSPVMAGFPSPAEEYVEQQLNLHEHVVRNEAATFFLRVAGDSMVDAGIHDGDLLVVDRSLQARHGHVVIASLQGEFTVKFLMHKQGRFYLVPGNAAYAAMDISEMEDVSIWGVVTYVIHKFGSQAMGACRL